MYTFESELRLAAPLSEVFPFFADACNLERITPSFLEFKVLTPAPIEMRPGALIDYRLRVRGVPVRWRTEISDWEPPFRFVDQQLRGPYRQWVHEHRFAERDGQTIAWDRVQYDHIGGRLVNRLVVAPDVRRIFDYRAAVLRELFGFA